MVQGDLESTNANHVRSCPLFPGKVLLDDEETDESETKSILSSKQISRTSSVRRSIDLPRSPMSGSQRRISSDHLLTAADSNGSARHSESSSAQMDVLELGGLGMVPSSNPIRSISPLIHLEEHPEEQERNLYIVNMGDEKQSKNTFSLPKGDML